MIVKAAEVLKEIHRDRSLNIADLSRRLGASPEAIRRTIASLQDQGYLRAEEQGCCGDDPGWLCRFCPARDGCQTGSLGIKFYYLTAEGRLRITGRDEARREI